MEAWLRINNFQLSLSNKSKSIHFYDFGPHEHSWESLTTIHVVSRMPTRGFLSAPPNTYPPGSVFQFLGPQKHKKTNFAIPETLKNDAKPLIGYRIVPSGLPQHPKRPSLGPTSIPIPTPASDHGSLAESFARSEVDAVATQIQFLHTMGVPFMASLN